MSAQTPPALPDMYRRDVVDFVLSRATREELASLDRANLAAIETYERIAREVLAGR